MISSPSRDLPGCLCNLDRDMWRPTRRQQVTPGRAGSTPDHSDDDLDAGTRRAPRARRSGGSTSVEWRPSKFPLPRCPPLSVQVASGHDGPRETSCLI